MKQTWRNVPWPVWPRETLGNDPGQSQGESLRKSNRSWFVWPRYVLCGVPIDKISICNPPHYNVYLLWFARLILYFCDDTKASVNKATQLSRTVIIFWIWWQSLLTCSSFSGSLNVSFWPMIYSFVLLYTPSTFPPWQCSQSPLNLSPPGNTLITLREVLKLSRESWTILWKRLVSWFPVIMHFKTRLLAVTPHEGKEENAS